MSGRRARRSIALGAVAFGVLFAAGLLAVGHRLLEERRSLVLRAIEGELRSTLNTVSQLLAERARDIRNDLEVVTELSQQHGPGSDETIELVRSNLIALDRSTRNYVRFWYADDGEILTDVSGFRTTPFPIPSADVAAIAALERRARAAPGTVVTAPMPPGGERRFRLFAMAPARDAAAIVLVADLDALFETLQRRARLPGTELWVLDSDLGVLVDPSDEHRSMEETFSSSPEQGLAVLGPPPSLLPLSNDGLDSKMVAWTSTRVDALRWTIGVGVPLAAATRQVQELSQRLVFFTTFSVLLLAAAGVIAALHQRRELARAEREQYASTVARLRDQLVRAEKLSMIGQLASGVAHEIGTPLGVIAIRVDQLLARAATERDAPALTVVKEEIARINRIIQQLLDFSRQRQAQARAVPLHVSVARVRALIGHRFDQKDVELETAVDESLVVHADPDQLEQVLLNLLLNACDACRTRDAVHLGARAAGHVVEIEVRDTGAGIPAEHLERIFDPFFTTKLQGGGTGLGLTVAQELVKSHGGTITAASSPEGTRFIISWPATAQDRGEQS